MKDTSFTRFTKKLLVALECLKDRAFDSADCLRSFVIMPHASSVVARINFPVFAIIRSRCEAIFSHDVAKEGT